LLDPASKRAARVKLFGQQQAAGKNDVLSAASLRTRSENMSNTIDPFMAKD
jgi:hypothetical protein